MTNAHIDPLTDLLQTLELSDSDGARTNEDIFVGTSQKRINHRVYGGQVLAQSLMAASHTVPDGRPVHSMHGYFLRAGDANDTITFGVERLRDGRSFSARRVHAYQKGQTILSMTASFQIPAPGLDHQTPMPEGVPGPETLPSAAELLSQDTDHPLLKPWLAQRPFDIRYVQQPAYLRPAPERVARQEIWLKATGPLPADQTIHRAALAYASDYVLLEPTLRRHGLASATPGLSVASLDHAMWWHRPVQADEWLLYTVESPSASGARGLGMGRFYTQDGTLVASTAQEGMIRVPEDILAAHDGAPASSE